MPEIKTVIGFDFGSKYIGVAVGQTSPSLAQALTSLTVKNGELPWKEIERNCYKFGLLMYW